MYAAFCVVDERPRVEAVDVGGRVERVVPRVVEPRRVVEHVAQGRGDALVLVALRGEALGARVERDAEGWVVRVQAHDFADRGGQEAEAGRVE